MKSGLIPSRLDHDGLKNAIVNISVQTDYNANFLVSKLLENNDIIECDEELRLLPIQNVAEDHKVQYFVGNSVYRVQIIEGVISFNFVRTYTLWTNYRKFIESCLNVLSGYIRCSHVQLQYISSFEDCSLFDNLDGEIRLIHLPKFAGSEFRFSFMVSNRHDSYRQANAMIRLTDSFVAGPESTVSVVDISLQGDIAKGNTLMDYLDFLHLHEKNLFFLMLKKEFIDTLGAHYED